MRTGRAGIVAARERNGRMPRRILSTPRPQISLPRNADALLNIQDRAAIPLWQALLKGADESFHDVARQAITALESL